MAFIVPSLVGAESLLHIPNTIWNGLTDDERKIISNNYIVSEVEDRRYGKVISSHIENNSYINNNSMSNLGSLLGQASYIDDNWDSYSAKDQVLAGVLGALVGSALDKKTEINIIATYTVEFLDGSVKDIKVRQKNSHLYGFGVCLDTKHIVSANSFYCRKNYVEEILSEIYENKEVNFPDRIEKDIKTVRIQDESENPSESNVTCKLGNGEPFITTKSICMKVKGTIL